MPGLTGVFRMSNPDIDVNALLTKMSQEMKHEDWYTINTFIDKSIGVARVSLGIFNPESQPIYNENNTLWIMMDGEIYDYENLKNDLVAKGHKLRNNNDPEFVLHLYEEYGKASLRKLNGSFVLFIFDYKTKKLLIANDRYGLRPLYYAVNNGYLLFATEMKAIIKDDSFERVIDEGAVSDFVLFRCILGTKTFFRDIKQLSPASIMSCNSNKISIENYWDFNFQEDKGHSEEYYIKQLSELLLQAIKRRLKGNHKIGVSLSGGRDSRIVLAAAASVFPSVRAYTWGEVDCNDAKFARLVTRKLSIQHLFLEYKSQDFVSFLEKGVYLTEVILDVDSLGMVGRLKEIKEFLDVELNGVGDPAVRGLSMCRQIDSCENEEHLHKALYNLISINLPDDLFNKEFYHRIRETSQNSLKDLLNKYNDRPFSNRVIHFIMREVFPSYQHSDFQIKNRQFERRTPYLDNDLIDFAQKIPVSLRDKSYIWNEMFVRLFPDLAEIPLQSTELPVKTSKSSMKINKIYLITRFKKRLSRLCGIPVKSKLLADYHRWFREDKEIQKYIKDILLSQKAKSRGYFNSEAVQRILEEQFTGRKNNWRLITRLVTFEIWHKVFVDEGEHQICKR